MNITKIITTLLFAAFTSSAIANPTVTECCNCFKITVQGMAADGTFHPNTKGEYIAYVRVIRDPQSGTNCPATFKVAVGAAPMWKKNALSGKSYEVEVSGTEKIVEFKLTEEEARYADEWRFGSVCASVEDKNEVSVGKEKGVDVPGCESIDISLKGCAACKGSCQATGQASASNGKFSQYSGTEADSGFYATIGTTSSMGGQADGTLTFHAETFANAGRSALIANVPSDFTVNRSGDIITSIQTGAGSVEVAAAAPALLALDPNAFIITHKDTSGSVFRTTTISFVTEGGLERLRMDTTFEGSTTRSEQTRPQSGTFVMETGKLVSNTFEPLSRDTLVRTKPSAGARVDRRTISERPTASAAWSTTSDTEETWEKQYNGWKKTKAIINPSGAALTSTWAYYQPGEITGSGGSYEGVGELKQHTSYDGSTSFHTYTLNQTSVTTPYAGNPAGKVTKSTWNPGTLTATDTTEINGIMVSKSVTIHTPTTRTNVTHTSAAGTLTTVTHYLPSGQDFGGRPVKTLHPDGTLTTYAYTRNPGGGSTTTTENGSTTDNNTVAKGTRSITTTNSRGTTILSKTEAVGYGTGNAIFSSMAVTSIDNLGRPLTTAHHPTTASVTGEAATAAGAAYTTTMAYSCCGTAKEVDMYGIPTFYAYDHLQRQIKTNRLGVTSETHYKGLTTEEHRYPEVVAASLSPALNGTATTLVSKSVSNLAGTLQESWSPDPSAVDVDGNGIPGALAKSTTSTTYQPAAGLSTRTVTTTPDNFTQTTDSFLDGRTAATYGALSPAMTYAYTVNPTGEFTKQAYTSGGTYYEAQGTQADWAGRTLQSGSLSPGTGAVSGLAACVLQSFVSNEFNSLGQMIKSTDPDGVTTLMAYNAEGEATITAIDLNQNNQIDYGTDTVSSSETDPALNGSNPVMLSISKVWQPGDNDPDGGTIFSTSKRSPSGLSSTSQSLGVANSSSSLILLEQDNNGIGTGNWTTTTTAPDGTKSLSTYTAGRMFSMASLSSDNSVIESQTQGYDSLNRPTTSTHSRTGITTTNCLSTTADVVKSVTVPGNRTTAFTYDIRGRQISVNLPDSVDADGAPLLNVTTTTYNPDSSVQETNGDQTYRVSHTYDYADRQVTMTTYGTSTATTEWKYSPDRGFLTEKNYHGETDDGQADADYTYTAVGRLLTRKWERGVTTSHGYDNGGRLTSTNYSDTTPDVAISYDAMGRQTSQSNGLATSAFAYNASNLQIDTETVNYDLNADSIIDFTRVIDRSQDNLARESGWELKSGATVENSVTYNYHPTDGRIETIRGGGLHPPSQFKYTYETNSYGLIKTLTNHTDPITSPIHTVTNTWETDRDVLASKQNKVGVTGISGYQYGVNLLGQRTNAAQTGTAFGSVRDITWGYNAKGEVVKADSTIPGLDRAYVYDGIGNRLKAADSLTLPTSNNYTPNALNQYTAIDTLNPVHDADGNMTSGPLPANFNANSTLIWDGENRLIQAQFTGGATVNFIYDAQSRRIAETVGANTTIYIYDGWNPICEYWRAGSQPAALAKSYLWGIDLSGSIQGAGGVGGLLAVTDSAGTYYPTFDGNGNVSEYLDSTGAIAAHYEYDAFGRTTVATGSKANDFSHRFSTKSLDAATGLYYYGFRWYDSSTGRWPSKDPIEEDGGINLYGFTYNSPLSHFDFLGMDPIKLDNEQQKIQLDYTISNPPDKNIGSCGDIKFIINWVILNGKSHQKLGGYIIQEVTFKWKIDFKCKGDDVGDGWKDQGPNLAYRNNNFKSPLTYWEAWRVKPRRDGNDGLTPVKTDTFEWNTNSFTHNGERINNTGHCGKARIEGSAAYHDGIDKLPNHMRENNNATLAGNLWASLQDPRLGGTKSNISKHWVEFKWNCCPGTKSKKTEITNWGEEK